MGNSIKNWSEEDKPREKLIQKGVSNVTDAELIAILIGSGNRNQTAVDLARDILLQNNSNLNKLGTLSVNDLMKFPGIGQAKAVTIVAALELGKRRKQAEVVRLTKITSAEHVHNYMYPILGDLKYEEFWVIFLNQANKIIGKEKIGQGGINSTTVDIRLVMKSAIENVAVSIILCHNHPSGNLIPSSADKTITNKILEAGKMLDITLLDHLIIAGDSFFSFKKQNLL